MNILDITYPDINNGLGCRATLWIAGCTHQCKFCQNPESWNPKAGRKFTLEDKEKLFSILSLPYIKGLTLSGGDPLCFYKDEVLKLCDEVHETFLFKDIWLYTGFAIEVIPFKDLNHFDYVVSDPFIQEKRNVGLAFRGSSNQRIFRNCRGLRGWEDVTKILDSQI